MRPPLPEPEEEGPGTARIQQFFSAPNRGRVCALTWTASTHGTVWLERDCYVLWETTRAL